MGSEQLADLREEEQWKVRCGLAHFTTALGVEYKVVSDKSELPEGGCYSASAVPRG